MGVTVDRLVTRGAVVVTARGDLAGVGSGAVPARDDGGEAGVDIALVHVTGPVGHGVSSGAAGWDDDLRTAVRREAARPGALESGRRATKGGPVFYWLLKRSSSGRSCACSSGRGSRARRTSPRGPAIFASNHLSFSDSIFLPLVVPRRVTFLAKTDYFTGTGIKGRLTAAFFRGVGQVPVDRSGGRACEAALRTGLKVLGRGELLGIYPEGTRSPDGRLYRGKTGVARMALEAGVPGDPGRDDRHRQDPAARHQASPS